MRGQLRSTYAIEPPDAAEVRCSIVEVDIEAEFAEGIEVIDSCEPTANHYNVVVLGHVDDLELMADGITMRTLRVRKNRCGELRGDFAARLYMLSLAAFSR